MRLRRRPIKMESFKKAAPSCDGAEFLNCVRFLHEEAQRMGYIDLANILAQTFDDCAESLAKDKPDPV